MRSAVLPAAPRRGERQALGAVADLFGIGWVVEAKRTTGEIRRRIRPILQLTYVGCGTAARQGYRCDGCRIHDREPALYDHGLDIPHALQMVRLTFDCIHGGRRADGAPGLNPHWRMTEDGLARMARAVLTGTVAATAARYRTDTRKVSEFQAGLRRELAVAIAIPAELSVDDLHLIGRGTCTVITDPRHRRFIALVKGHPHEAFVPWLVRQPGHDTLRAVVTDGDVKLRAALRQHLPEIAHGADPFHKVKLVTDEVIAASRGLLPKAGRRLIAAEANAGSASRRDGLNRLLRKRWHRLSKRQQQLLEALFDGCPDLGELYALREGFAAFYRIRSPDLAASALDGWLAAIPAHLTRFFGTPRKTIGRTWRAEVLAYFRRRLTQGFTEAINRRIKERHRATGCTQTVAELELWARVRYGGYGAEAIDRAIATVAARPRPKRCATERQPREGRHAA